MSSHTELVLRLDLNHPYADCNSMPLGCAYSISFSVLRPGGVNGTEGANVEQLGHPSEPAGTR
jgi:hypothetical protein